MNRLLKEISHIDLKEESFLSDIDSIWKSLQLDLKEVRVFANDKKTITINIQIH